MIQRVMPIYVNKDLAQPNFYETHHLKCLVKSNSIMVVLGGSHSDLAHNESYFYRLFIFQSAAWIGFTVWLAQTVLTIIRYFRNRRARQQDDYNPDITTSDTRQIAKENPTA